MAGALSRFDPFAELSALQKQLFSDGIFGMGRRQLPTTDIYTEDDSKLTVEAHLPGYAQNDIDIDVEEGALVIRAERHEKEEDKGKKYVVRESSSSYYRRIGLPDQADMDAVTASFAEGVLRVTVPYKQPPGTRKVAISGAQQSQAAGTGGTNASSGAESDAAATG